MKNETLIKLALIFGGGFGLFMLLKPKIGDSVKSSAAPKETKSFDNSTPTPKKEDVKIVTQAYKEAVKNGESASRLTELNKELMKEFGMRCFVEKSGEVIACDVKGNPIN
jgi:hypothetical protein